jgi:hypothetical protein
VQSAGRKTQTLPFPFLPTAHCLPPQRIPLPLKINDFVPALDKLVKLEIAEHFILHDRVIHHLINGVSREVQNAPEGMSQENM